MTDLPRKLTPDAIVEAMVELRYEHQDLWEVVVGRLASADFMTGCEQQRLPAGEMPAQMRDLDPNLRYSPTIQLQRGDLLVRLGPRVMSVHVVAPYPGWNRFSPIVRAATEALFGTRPIIRIERLGLRYINAFGEMHGVTAINHLRLSVTVGDEAASNFALTHRIENDREHLVNVSIATREFVVGNIPSHAKLVADIDVFKEQSAILTTADDVTAWFEKAHDVEKMSFFSLLDEETVERLRER